MDLLKKTSLITKVCLKINVNVKIVSNLISKLSLILFLIVNIIFIPICVILEMSVEEAAWGLIHLFFSIKFVKNDKSLKRRKFQGAHIKF